MSDFLLTEEARKLAGLSKAKFEELLTDSDGKLKENAGDLYLKAVSEKVSILEQEQYNKGIRQKGTAIERAIKPLFDKYGVQAGTAEEGIEALIGAIEAKPPTGGGNLTKDELVKLKEFQELLDENLALIKAEKEQAESKYAQLSQSITEERTQSAVMRRAFDVLTSKNAVFGQNPMDQLKVILNGSGVFSKVKVEGDSVKLVDQDGNPLRDDHKNPISFDDYISETWTSMGLQFSDTGSDAPPRSGRKPTESNVNPANLREALANAKDPAERAKLLKQAAAAMRKG